MSLSDRLATWLRLPPPPEPPEGDREVQRLRAAPNYFRLRQAGWVLEQVGTLGGILFGLAFLDRFVPDQLSHWIWPLEALGAAFWLVQMPVTYARLRLDYDQRWYLVSDRSLRIREGIFRVQEQTLTFANIQNLTLHQGPLQRLLGICDLAVHTAGGGKAGTEGGATTAHHTGKLKGIGEGPAIRSLILDRVRRAGDEVAGSADIPTESRETLSGVVEELLGALRDCREVIRSQGHGPSLFGGVEVPPRG